MSGLCGVLPTSGGLETFQAAFEFAPSALALVEPGRPQPTFVSANAAFLDLMAPSSSDVAGRGLGAVFLGTAAIQVRRAVRACLDTGESVRLRILHSPDDEAMRIEIVIRRITTDHGALAVIALAPLDAHVRLADLGELGVLAELGPLSRGLVYICDVRRGRWRLSGHPLGAALGLAQGSQDRRELEKILHPDDLARFAAFRGELKAADDSRVARGTFRLRDKDGEWLWLNFRTRVFTRDPSGAVDRTIGVITDMTETYVHAQAMADAAENLAHAEVNERRRIGRELHDSTSQLLVAAQLGLAALPRRLRPESAGLVEEASRSISAAQEEIRNFSYVLHPPLLQREGLAGGLRAFGRGYSRRTGLAVSVRVGRGMVGLSPPVELALYRIAQEALMNVHRHAGARTARIRLRQTKRCAVLEVEDDGVGLPLPLQSSDGLGISGMRARMTQLGGALDLISARKGLLVRATVPLTPPVNGLKAPVAAALMTGEGIAPDTPPAWV